MPKTEAHALIVDQLELDRHAPDRELTSFGPTNTTTDA
jgi:hypothetical protein